MRKVFISTAAAVIAATVSVVSVFAAVGSSITVKTDKSEVSYTYKAGDNNEAKADASKLFGNFRNASKDDFSTESFTITSKTQNGSNVEIALLVEAASVSEEYSPLDYYSFVVTADSGEVLYDGTAEEAADVSATSKEIPFGKFNTQFTTDTKKFTVDYKINSDVAEKIDEDTLEGVTVSVVSRIVKPEPAATNAPAAGEGEYTVEVAASDPEEVVAAATTATAAPAADASPAPTAEAVELNGVKKVCGKDMTAGRYLVSGNGIVRIEGADGSLKSETTVTDGSNEGVDGVGAFVASIVDGDVITAAPLPGKEKPSVKFEKTNSPTSTASANVAASNTNANAAKAAAKASAAPTAKPKTAAKSNPKTGEDSAEIAWLCGLMAAMAAGVVGLEIIKRKKAN